MVIGALPYWGKSASAFFGNQAVYEQDNDSADNRTYPAGAFAWLVEPQGATQVACHDSTDNTQDDGHDNAQFLVTRHNCPCKQTHDKANDDHADDAHGDPFLKVENRRSEERTSELQSLMRISYAVFCLKKKNTQNKTEESNLMN